MKKFFSSGIFSKLIITLFIFSLLSGCVQFSAQCSDISDKVLRLHILANSDSDEDQQIKLKLRDALLENSDNMLGFSLTKGDAIVSAKSKLDYIDDFCNQKLQEMGSNCTASCEITNMYFDTRTYGDSTMPAGFYDALRIKIGKGEGHNWWCVLFPPICLSGAVEEKDVFSDEEEKILNNNGEYEFRFKILEIYDYLRSLI